ncbi:hypothetical protein E2C01_021324 [Portunus trituberculatus]|uniref:Uncharacterized protein n=1 Tax=Portunus trituberculatus TaxID=210409 RepID=A0A5B7E3X6_PORTR|nr:hypothetical protein [Portunus trituberculatus]
MTSSYTCFFGHMKDGGRVAWGEEQDGGGTLGHYSQGHSTLRSKPRAILPRALISNIHHKQGTEEVFSASYSAAPCSLTTTVSKTKDVISQLLDKFCSDHQRFLEYGFCTAASEIVP